MFASLFIGGAFYRRVEDDRCLRFENLTLKLSEDDDKTKCKDGARWFTAERDILSAVDYYYKRNITVDKCLYTWEPATLRLRPRGKGAGW